MSHRRKRIRLDRRTIVGLAGLAVLTIAVGWWRATSIVNRLLRGWAVGVVAQQSAGVYQLDPIGVHVNWFFRRVVVDSFRLTTDRRVNGRQPQPLANVRIGLSHCTISGVHVLTLARGAGLIAASMGCTAGSVAVEVPRRVWDGTTAAALTPPPRSGDRAGFLVLQQGLRLPSYAPRVQITQITFPALAFDFRLPLGRSGETRLSLERLQWGILGGGGILGGAARGIASMMANWQVRGNNPGHPTKPPLSGRIRSVFRSDQTLPAFLWAGVAGGLLQVVRQ